MKFSTTKEAADYIWRELGLDNRSISFFYWEPFGDPRLGSGIISTAEELEDSSEFCEAGEEYAGESEIDVFSVESYVCGTGETDHADVDDIRLLEEVMRGDNYHFNGFLADIADCCCSFGGFTLENPMYEPDDEEEDEYEDD